MIGLMTTRARLPWLLALSLAALCLGLVVLL
ncbi:MAG: hypothetical protein JWM65_2181 [Sphingomonas bacterium]|nr:hypothetical protein [Sphingomonas bacterium]